MPQLRLDISIILQRAPVASRWISDRWEPVAVEVADPKAVVVPRAAAEVNSAPSAVRRTAAVDPTEHAVYLLHDSIQGTRWRFTGHALELHRSEGEGYYLNLTAPEPKVFVMWRMLEPEALVEGGPAARPELATVSYNEAARMLDGGEQVDAVPLPAEVRAWMEPFVAENYKPEPKRKVHRRDPLRDDTAGNESSAGKRR